MKDDVQPSLLGHGGLRESAVMSTFSIVAADAAAGEVGVAVQSRYLAVGAVVPWARAGVGAVATQAMGFAGFGPVLLDALGRGESPAAALERALGTDPLRARRQVGVVTASGESANHTGAECMAWAGGLIGPGFAAQGNILAGEAVVGEMARVFQAGSGRLAERLMSALEAGQAAGGDKRGEQSAALIVERRGYASETGLGIDRVIDLRVDDHLHPIVELRRLLGLRLRQEVSFRAMKPYLEKDYLRAVEIMSAGAAEFPDSPEVLYDLACFESLAGSGEEALTHLRRALELAPGMRTMAADDGDFDPVRADPRYAALVKE